MFDFVQPHIAAWRVRRFGGQAWRDEAARQGHLLPIERARWKRQSTRVGSRAMAANRGGLTL
jgi:hypothetical protein